MQRVAGQPEQMPASRVPPPEESMPWIVPLRDRIEAELARTIAETDLPDNLREAVEYALLGGGKRVRPILCLISAQAAGGDDHDAMPAAVALELIHCFSLVHDDLPAMDDDDLRRGRPTLHVHASDAMAILAGDVMETLAFQVLARTNLAPTLTDELAQATRAMIAGQVWDTLGGPPEKRDRRAAGGFWGPTDADRLHCIHNHKTGALIRASCRMGAISAGAGDAAQESLTRYGDAIGLMFQIVDDLLDVTQSSEHLGKASGKDEAAGKLTFPGVYGMERSREMIAELKERATAALTDLGPASRPLARLCDYLAVRTR